MEIPAAYRGVDGSSWPAVALREGDNSLYALMNPIALEESTMSTHPAWARGVATINCYLLVEEDAALLIDTGVSIHQDAILAQLAGALPLATPLSILVNRIGDYNSIANVRPIVERRDVHELIAIVGNGADWVDVRSDWTPFGTPSRSGRLAGVGCRGLSRMTQLDVGRSGLRRLEVIRAEFQCLPVFWFYDETTRTLFTGEMFSHVWRRNPAEPLFVDSAGGIDVDLLCDFLADGGKYWWLVGARTDSLRRWLARILAERDIDCVAPSYGCVLRGSDVVDRHFEALGEALARLSRRPATGARLVPAPRAANVLGGHVPAPVRSSPELEGAADAAPVRELAPGVHWLGACLEVRLAQQTVHGKNSLYLVSGDAWSLLVEAGAPTDVGIVEPQLEALLARPGIAPLRYVFPTHPESPHSGGVGRILDRFPGAVACGDPTDLTLGFPWLADRIQELRVGDSLDLGGTMFTAVPAVLRDHGSSRWGFDARSRVLFTGDGLSYTHYHAAGQCDQTVEEVGSLDIPRMTAAFVDAAFYWTKFVDVEPYIERLESLLDELDVDLLAPTHGLPIADRRRSLPEVYAGLRAGAKVADSVQSDFEV